MTAITRFMESHPRAKKLWDRLCVHGATYWLVALGLTVLGVFSGIYIEDHYWWTDMRYRATQEMQDLSICIKRPLYTLYQKRTALVFIGDQEYVYDSHGMLPAVSLEPCPTVSRGYVQLPYDVRRVPLPLPLDTDPSSTVDSFATAIVKCVDPVAYARTVNSGKDELPFAGYIPLNNFPVSKAGQEAQDKSEGMSASEVLDTPCATNKCLRGKIVIISGNW